MQKIAVIDIGSNSVRLLLRAEQDERTFLSTTRLGEGAKEKRLTLASIARTVQAINEFAAMARSEGFAVVAFATSAVRDAVNAAQLLDEVRATCSVEIDVLSGEQEALAAYLGASGGREVGVIDLGGSSTELVEGRGGRVERSVSLQMGAVRLKALFEQDRAAAEAYILEQYRQHAFAYPLREYIAIGGTASALASVQLALPTYAPEKIEGTYLTREWIAAFTEKVWEMPLQEREHIPGLHKKRADIIAHGALIFTLLLKEMELDGFTVSLKDNLPGYLLLREAEDRPWADA